MIHSSVACALAIIFCFALGVSWNSYQVYGVCVWNVRDIDEFFVSVFLFSLFYIFFIHSFASAFLSLSVFVLLCLSCFTGFLSLMCFLGTNLKWIFVDLLFYSIMNGMHKFLNVHPNLYKKRENETKQLQFICI